MRRPALLWALLHAPLFALLYGASLGRALGDVPGGFRALLWPAFAAEALGLSLLAWALGLPFSPWPRVHRIAAPTVTALFAVAVALDAQLHRVLGFHVNGFFFRVLLQPRALTETGLPAREVALWSGAAVVAVAADAALGAWAMLRLRRGRAWPLALPLLLVAAGERLYTASLAFAGGPAVFAAGQVLPFQVPLRVNGWLSELTGRPRVAVGAPLARAEAAGAARLPAGLAPGEVRFTRRPDVVLALVESLPAAHLDAATMPRLWARAAAGSRFTRHYASATSTHYTVFSLLSGLRADRLEAAVRAGRRPLLFAALRANGYRLKLVTASSVDWMGLLDTTFADVRGELDTDFTDALDTSRRDEDMLAVARAAVERAGDEPVFLFLFFDGTHFPYDAPPGSRPFGPAWGGEGGLAALRAPPEEVRNRARNAAFEVDRKLDGFLAWMEARRGRAPLVAVTGDHGEEYGEAGRRGHSHGVSAGETHVPLVLLGPGVPAGVVESPTSHVDLVPTLFRLLGDGNSPSGYADGIDAFAAPPGRFVISTVGWEPRFAVIGRDLKVRFDARDAGLGAALLSDPEDRPLRGARARFAAELPAILAAFGPAAGSR